MSLHRDQSGNEIKGIAMFFPVHKVHQESKRDKITNERQAVIKEFVEAINKDRDGVTYKKLPPSAIAVKLSHLSIFDLYFFLKACKEAKNFSAYFWYALKAGEENGQKRLI